MSILYTLYFIILTLSIILITVLFILWRRRPQSSLTNSAFIAPLITEAIEETQTTSEQKITNELEEKTNEISKINNLITQTQQAIKKEEQDLEQKIQKNTFDLREEYAKFYASIDNLSLGFIITDKEKNIIFLNKTIKDLFYSDPKTNIKLQVLQDQTHGKIDLFKNHDNVLRNSLSLSFEHVNIGDKHVNIFISPVILQSETIGTVILTKDITWEYINEKSKEDFFTIASHELRAPLTAIRGYIAIIKQFFYESIKDEELKKIINDVDTLSVQLINIVNDFLDTPKLEQGKIRVKKEPCDLIPIINTSIKETGSIATQKKLYIKFSSSFESAKVLGDKEKIRQVLINLISNGLKYTQEGGIIINIDKTPNSQYKISIKDTGKGVSQENTKLLFTKFQRIDPSKGSHLTSTGLGLYISKLLIEKMNGTIQLENTEEGKGSTFSFSLPVYETTIANNNLTRVN